MNPGTPEEDEDETAGSVNYATIALVFLPWVIILAIFTFILYGCQS